MALSATGFLFGFLGRPKQIVIPRCFNSWSRSKTPNVNVPFLHYLEYLFISFFTKNISIFFFSLLRLRINLNINEIRVIFGVVMMKIHCSTFGQFLGLQSNGAAYLHVQILLDWLIFIRNVSNSKLLMRSKINYLFENVFEISISVH